MIVRRLLLLLAPLMIAAAAHGDDDPKVVTSLSKYTVTVGDTLTYRLSVSGREGARILLPPPTETLGDFYVIDHKAGYGETFAVEEYVLAVYFPGEHAVPPRAIHLIGSRGDTASVFGDTLFVTVASVLGEGDETLRDIKGPATLPSPALWPRVALAAAVLAAAAALAVLMIRRRRAPKLIPAGPPVPPHVAALERLERLLESRLLESGRVKEFYTELSDVLRTYLSNRFLLPAPELTTAELYRRMEYLGLPEDFRDETFVVLEESDMVKFAKYKPAMEAALTTAKTARSLVRENAEPQASGELES